MHLLFPPKLRPSDTIRIIAPSRSLAIIDLAIRKRATARLASLGFQVTFGAHVEERDAFDSTSVAARIADLHAAFADPDIAGILTVIGGFNSNQLLRSIDWDLIQAHPKVLCGFSDITALNNAILAKTGVVTYSGPHYSSFGRELHVDDTIDHFKRCVMTDESILLTPSAVWSDRWGNDEEAHAGSPNEGFISVQPGEAEGMVVGGNLCTLNLLQGTAYMPNLRGTLLFIEDDDESQPHTFDRDLQSLIHQPGFDGVRGLLIGRFMTASRMTSDVLRAIVTTKPQLRDLPIMANVDFGHTDPKITFPVGGTARMVVTTDTAMVEIVRH